MCKKINILKTLSEHKNPIEESWKIIETYMKGSSENQKEVCRVVFYLGFRECFGFLFSDEDDLSEEDSGKVLDIVQRSLRLFYDELKVKCDK